MIITLEIAIISKDTITSIRKVLKWVEAKILFYVFPDFVMQMLYSTYIHIYLFIYNLQAQWHLQNAYNFLTLKDSNFYPGWLFYVFPAISV